MPPRPFPDEEGAFAASALTQWLQASRRSRTSSLWRAALSIDAKCTSPALRLRCMTASGCANNKLLLSVFFNESDLLLGDNSVK